MQTVDTISELRRRLSSHRQSQQSVALVPTMGNLHRGHLQLVAEALANSDIVVTSIFVNPLQFGPEEDFASYPRTLASDARQLLEAGCHYLFAPDELELYGADSLRHSHRTMVQIAELSRLYCGASRPGHFAGVTTVVCKLLNIVQPDSAFFGLKDYQQFVLIRQMVRDLCFAVNIVGVETVRAPSGLAISSRNSYLNPQQLTIAAGLYGVLQSCAAKIRQGQRQYPALQEQAMAELAAAGMAPDYVAVCDAAALHPAKPETREFAILAAAAIGPTRLIDNVRLQVPT